MVVNECPKCGYGCSLQIAASSTIFCKACGFTVTSDDFAKAAKEWNSALPESRGTSHQQLHAMHLEAEDGESKKLQSEE